MMRSAPAPVLRVARPTANLQALSDFYCQGLGFEVLGGFQGHSGFDGVMLGHRGWPYHLEFTSHTNQGDRSNRGGVLDLAAPHPDHLLVFYLPDRQEWLAAVDRFNDLGHPPVPALNPYWDRLGRTFADPDGWRLVLQNACWPL